MIALIALLLTPAQAMPMRGFSDVYPPGALRRHEQGRTRIHFDVTEQGRAENCQIVASSGSADLDQATCDIVLRRARFKPARDDSGKPVRDTIDTSINWRLPN